LYKNIQMFDRVSSLSRSSKYHSLEYCDGTLGIDNLLRICHADRDVIINTMTNNPQQLIDDIWTVDGLLASDESCKCNMGKGDRHAAAICAQCHSLRRIIDFRVPVVGRSFTIECGARTGKQLMVSQINVQNPILLWDAEASRRAQSYVLQHQKLLSCGTPNISGMKCIAGDNFTIRVLHTLMINKLLADKHLPHSVQLHTAFICGGVGYMLNDAPSIGSFDELRRLYACNGWSDNDVLSIVQQLLVVLTELSKVNFSHGHPTIDALLFDKEPVSYNYNGTIVSGRFTLKLANLWNASAKYGNYHYFPFNESANLTLQRSIFMPEIVTRVVANGQTSGPVNCSANLYRLTNLDVDIHVAMRHIGFPLFVGSFDFYCLLTALMMDQTFYNTVMTCPTLTNLWINLWQPEDLPVITQRLLQSHRSANSVQPVNIIKSLWLRCDVISQGWSLLK
jgi:hypothetical protein